MGQTDGVLEHVYSVEARVRWEANFANYDDEDLKHAHKRMTGFIIYEEMGSQNYPVFHTEIEWDAPRPIARQFEILKHYVATPGTGIQQTILDAVNRWHQQFKNRFPNNRALKICYQCPYKEYYEDKQTKKTHHHKQSHKKKHAKYKQ